MLDANGYENKDRSRPAVFRIGVRSLEQQEFRTILGRRYVRRSFMFRHSRRTGAALQQDASGSTCCDSFRPDNRQTTRNSCEAFSTKKSTTRQVSPIYVELWNATGASHPSEIANRAIRYLSWKTDIAAL